MIVVMLMASLFDNEVSLDDSTNLPLRLCSRTPRRDRDWESPSFRDASDNMIDFGHGSVPSGRLDCFNPDVMAEIEILVNLFGIVGDIPGESTKNSSSWHNRPKEEDIH